MGLGLSNYFKATVLKSSESVGMDARTDIGSTAKEHIGKLDKLPKRVGQRTIVNEKGRATMEKQGAENLKLLLESRKERVDAAVQSHQAIAGYRQHVMKAGVKIAGIDSNFGQALSLYGLQRGIQQAELTGIQRAMKGAETLVRG